MSATIACCLCGTQISPNEAAMCLQCLQLQVSKDDIISTNCEIVQCKKCERWHIRQDQWIHHELESAGLLAVCLKKINGLAKVKLLDAKWIWTEPHSKRLKLAIDLERNILNNKMNIQQRIVVEFIIKYKQCLDCIHDATDHTWSTLIQLRHRVGHKRTLYKVEYLLTKSNIHKIINNIQIQNEGLDLYFHMKNQAEQVVDLLSSNFPIKIKYSKKLISTNIHSNISRYEYTIIINIAPISKYDLIILPSIYSIGKHKHKNNIKNKNISFMLVTKVSACIHLINPYTLTQLEISSSKYFANPFYPVSSLSESVLYLVLDIEERERNEEKREIQEMGGVLADISVLRESEDHITDESSCILSHLGHILHVGDSVRGYDIKHTVLDETILSQVSEDLPDIILVKKEYIERGRNRKSSGRLFSGRAVEEREYGREGEREKGKKSKSVVEDDDKEYLEFIREQEESEEEEENETESQKEKDTYTEREKEKEEEKERNEEDEQYISYRSDNERER